MEQNTRAYYMNLAREAARRYGVPEDLFISLIEQESRFNPTAQSPKGAYGLTQLMPATAEELGVDPRNIEQNLAGGARYLNQMMTRFPDLNMALAAYNAGPTKVAELGRVPNYPETQNYIKSILGRLPDGRPRNMPLEAKMTERKPDMIGGKMGGLFGRMMKRDETTGLNFLENLAASFDPLIHPKMRAGADIRKQGAMRAAHMRGNRTADMLEKMPNGKMYADAIRQGADASVVYMQYIKDQKAGTITSEDMNKMVMDARKEFTGLQSVKDFSDVSMAFSRVVRSANDPSPAGDLALIFNFMKVLDPGSVVREGEFATAQNAGGVDERIRSLYNQVMDGTRLTETQRADFVDRAARLYQGAEEQYSSIAQQYTDFATRSGLDPSLVIPDFSFKGAIPEKPTILQIPPRPDSFATDAEWKQHWQEVMTEEERKAYLEA